MGRAKIIRRDHALDAMRWAMSDVFVRIYASDPNSHSQFDRWFAATNIMSSSQLMPHAHVTLVSGTFLLFRALSRRPNSEH